MEKQDVRPLEMGMLSASSLLQTRAPVCPVHIVVVTSVGVGSLGSI